jgi:hypothetical protein
VVANPSSLEISSARRPHWPAPARPAQWRLVAYARCGSGPSRSSRPPACTTSRIHGAARREGDGRARVAPTRRGDSQCHPPPPRRPGSCARHRVDDRGRRRIPRDRVRPRVAVERLARPTCMPTNSSESRSTAPLGLVRAVPDHAATTRLSSRFGLRVAAARSVGRCRSHPVDEVVELVGAVAKVSSGSNKGARVLDEGSFVGCGGDGDAATSAKFEQTFVLESAECAEHGVGVHAEDGGEVCCLRDAFAGLGFAVGDCAADLGGDLLVQSGARGAVRCAKSQCCAAGGRRSRRVLDSRHCATHTSAMMQGTGVRPAPDRHEAEVLFAEARRRRRRRRITAAAVVVALAGAAAAATITVDVHRGPPVPGHAPGHPVGAAPHRDTGPVWLQGKYEAPSLAVSPSGRQAVAWLHGYVGSAPTQTAWLDTLQSGGWRAVPAALVTAHVPQSAEPAT